VTLPRPIPARPCRRVLSILLLLACGSALSLFPDAARSADPAGTFSIVALDPGTGELGVAVQSRAFSVGSAVPWAEAGVGAIATQSATNESFGPLGLAMLREGRSAEETLKALLAEDPGRENRQVGIVDREGRAAAWTGPACSAWAGDSTAGGLAIQGNILAGRAVVAEMARAFAATQGELAERLLAALHAGQAAGGDIRGQQSAALLVVRPSERYPEYRLRYVDLRVEDHPSPIVELERVYRIHEAGDLLEAHVRYAAIYDSLGLSAAALRERERIASTLARTLARPDADAGTLNALAWYCALGNIHLEDALAAAQRAAALEPENTGILDTLAEVYFRMGRRGDALGTIRRALAIAPEDAYLKKQEERMSGP
jgi:uncharacterized Ntn-hydrolase superfamily protein